ncbi:MAG: GNAT family protein [Chloroflexota bacterium]
MLSDTITTERLRLRSYRLQDVDNVLSFATDPEWARYLPVPQPYTAQDAEQFIATQLLLDKESHQAWAIEIDNQVVGGINLRYDIGHYIGEMGYSIAKTYWGRGLITEAAKAVIDTAFLTYPMLNRIRAMADSRNNASLRVMEKLGMTREGCLRQNQRFRDEFIDEVWCGLLRNEWEDQRVAAIEDPT